MMNKTAHIALLVTVLVELLFAVVARGGFFQPESLIIAAASLVLAALSVLWSESVTPLAAEDLALMCLAGWWLLSATLHGSARTFVPLGASMLAFLAGSVVVRNSPPLMRVIVSYSIVVIGWLTAIAGLIACELRWFPMAMRGQDLWRLSGTLTYSNAAGLFLAMALLVAMDSTVVRRFQPLLVSGMAAGLLATQSRAALLAFLLGAVVFARSAMKANWPMLLIGSLAGAIVVASAAGHQAQPLALGASLAILFFGGLGYSTIASLADRKLRMISKGGRKILAGSTIILVAGFGGIAAHHQILKRVDLGSVQGRLREWHLAFLQFWHSPWIGVGPDRTLSASDTHFSTYFAHNEYLQLLAGGGLISATLLLLWLVLLARRLTRASVVNRYAEGALLAAGVGGLFDYTWHLPAIGLCAGLVFALCAPDELAGGQRTLGTSFQT